MNHLKVLKKHLLKELEKTEKMLTSARIARNNAPTAMGSKSDQSRSRLESEVAMHESRLKELKDTIDTIPEKSDCASEIGLWCYTKVQLPSKNLEAVIVPEGWGGIKIGKIQCISDKTPLGMALMGKKQGGEKEKSFTLKKLCQFFN